MRCLTQVPAFVHEFIHCFASFEQVLQIFVYNVLYLTQLVLDAEQLVGLHGVLPFFHVGSEAGELHRLVIGQLTCQ